MQARSASHETVSIGNQRDGYAVPELLARESVDIGSVDSVTAWFCVIDVVQDSIGLAGDVR